VSPLVIILCFAAYFGALLSIAWLTLRRGTSEQGYLLGGKRSPWWLVAFGLIGDSLSGVTFMSVPGEVGTRNFTYLQVVLGGVAGYLVVAHVLLPLYYRLELASIYGYLGGRFGPTARTTGAMFFVVSRVLGAAARLFLSAGVLQAFVFDPLGVPFWATSSTVILLMLVYTYRGGIQTLVWTDLFQSSLLLAGVVLSLVAVARGLDLDLVGLVRTVQESPRSQAFVWDWREPTYFWKQFIGAAAIVVAMTGLDQNMMQKSLSCPTIGEAQRNIHAFIPVQVGVNLLFLSLGVLLYELAARTGIETPARTDLLFPTLALQHLGTFAAVAFVLGLAAATFSSADSVLTTLTTSFSVDVLRLGERGDLDEAARTRIRRRIHAAFAAVLLLVILAFRAWSSESVISTVLRIAGYTYGPLLGLFALGILTRVRVRDRLVPVACVLAPVLCWILERKSPDWFGGYRMGFELLLVNAGITVALLLALWRPRRVGEG